MEHQCQAVITYPTYTGL